MFAKIVFVFATLAAVQATGSIAPIDLGKLGYGTEISHGIISYGAGLGYGGSGLISGGVPAVATQKAVINHVAPAAPVAAAAPIALVGPDYGLEYAGNGLLGGHGLALESGLLGAPYGLGLESDKLGYGEAGLIVGEIPAVATQKAVINHVAPAAPTLAAAPITLAGPDHGLGYAGHGLARGNGLLGAPYGLGLGAGKLGYGEAGLIAGRVPAVATQKAVINHVAPAAPAVAPIALARPNHGIGYAEHGLLGGHGFALGNGLLGAPYGLGLGAGKLDLGFGKALL